MQSIEQFFSFMHDVDFPYVVMRNWENLPDSVELGPHSDLDLMVYDLDHWTEVFPEAKRVFDAPRVQFKQPIGDDFIQIDVRSPGDGYYPKGFSQAMLETREAHPKGFFTPNALHHRIGLAYHAVHHKGVNKYKEHLGTLSIDDLHGALIKSRVGWVQPKDPSVGSFNSYWKGSTSVVKHEGDKVIKSQDRFEEYNLTANEARILKDCRSVHFPKVLNSNETELELEYCGGKLDKTNLPHDWRDQFIQILKDLDLNKVQHRDIRPDNLMVKDDVIKLIDFGWARFKDDPKDKPPKCLGYPYKPTSGFDDQYSLRMIARKIKNTCESLV